MGAYWDHSSSMRKQSLFVEFLLNMVALTCFRYARIPQLKISYSMKYQHLFTVLSYLSVFMWRCTSQEAIQTSHNPEMGKTEAQDRWHIHGRWTQTQVYEHNSNWEHIATQCIPWPAEVTLIIQKVWFFVLKEVPPLPVLPVILSVSILGMHL